MFSHSVEEIVRGIVIFTTTVSKSKKLHFQTIPLDAISKSKNHRTSKYLGMTLVLGSSGFPVDVKLPFLWDWKGRCRWQIFTPMQHVLCEAQANDARLKSGSWSSFFWILEHTKRRPCAMLHRVWKLQTFFGGWNYGHDGPAALFLKLHFGLTAKREE